MTPYPKATSPWLGSAATPGKTDARTLKPFRVATDWNWAARQAEADLTDRKQTVPTASASRLPEAAALVPEASAILDEEIAAGVLAARDARASGSGSAKSLGSGNAERWLLDLHNLVDALGEVLPRIQGYAANALDKSAGMGRSLEYESVPVLCPHASVRPGERARISLKLNNDDAGPAQVALFCTDLFSMSGARIPQHQVMLTPKQLQLAPDAYAEVVLEIAVPLGSGPGAYSGLLLTSGLSYLRAVIAIEVV